jgi:hypothetical protein
MLLEVRMALVVETGSGLAYAESYASLSDAAAYHAARGNAAWDDLDADVQEQALRRATDFMVGQYGPRFAGFRVTTTQALDWPRIGVRAKSIAGGLTYASDIVPLAVRNACAALALRAVSKTLAADQGQRKASVTVGPITTVYAAGSTPASQFPEVDAMLRPYLKAAAGQILMVRR